MSNPNVPRSDISPDDAGGGSFDDLLADAREKLRAQEAQRQAWEDEMEAHRLARHAEGRRGIDAADARRAEASQDYARIIEEFRGVKTPEVDPLSRTLADKVATTALIAALATHYKKFSEPIDLS